MHIDDLTNCFFCIYSSSSCEAKKWTQMGFFTTHGHWMIKREPFLLMFDQSRENESIFHLCSILHPPILYYFITAANQNMFNCQCRLSTNQDILTLPEEYHVTIILKISKGKLNSYSPGWRIDIHVDKTLWIFNGYMIEKVPWACY